MVQIFYFIHLHDMPIMVLDLNIDFDSYLSAAFYDSREIGIFKKNLVEAIMEEMEISDKKRKKLKQPLWYTDYSKEQIEDLVQIDNRYLAKMETP